jgi:hypothetical protein
MDVAGPSEDSRQVATSPSECRQLIDAGFPPIKWSIASGVEGKRERAVTVVRRVQDVNHASGLPRVI